MRQVASDKDSREGAEDGGSQDRPASVRPPIYICIYIYIYIYIYIC